MVFVHGILLQCLSISDHVLGPSFEDQAVTIFSFHLQLVQITRGSPSDVCTQQLVVLFCNFIYQPPATRPNPDPKDCVCFPATPTPADLLAHQHHYQHHSGTSTSSAITARTAPPKPGPAAETSSFARAARLHRRCDQKDEQVEEEARSSQDEKVSSGV